MLLPPLGSEGLSYGDLGGGHVDAQYNLGFMYRTGEGVPHDYAKAYMW
jgi:TPR repeat protein